MEVVPTSERATRAGHASSSRPTTFVAVNNIETSKTRRVTALHDLRKIIIAFVIQDHHKRQAEPRNSLTRRLSNGRASLRPSFECNNLINLELSDPTFKSNMTIMQLPDETIGDIFSAHNPHLGSRVQWRERPTRLHHPHRHSPESAVYGGKYRLRIQLCGPHSAFAYTTHLPTLYARRCSTSMLS